MDYAFVSFLSWGAILILVGLVGHFIIDRMHGGL